MRKPILLLALLLLGFAACKKDDSNEVTSLSYHVDGITDLTLVKGSRSGNANPSMNLSVTYANAAQERVSLSLEGVPAGLYYRIFNPSGIPTFNSGISFADSGVAEGVYPLKLIANGEYSGRRELKFNMRVTGIPDCSADLIGTDFSTQNFCTGATYLQNVNAVMGGHNHVQFTNIDGNGTAISAGVDCETNTLIVQEQVVNGMTYVGSGSYSNAGGQRSVSLFLQATTAGGMTTNCSYFLVK